MDNKNNGHNPMINPEIGTINANPGSMIGPNMDSNPGLKLISNDDKLSDMLKAVYCPTEDFARNVVEAFGECSEFYLDENGEISTLSAQVLERINWVKNMTAIMCSVNGRFADKYAQIVSGVMTNTMAENGQWKTLNIPSFSRQQGEASDSKGFNRKKT